MKRLFFYLLAISAILSVTSTSAFSYVISPKPKKILFEGGPVYFDTDKAVASSALKNHDPRILDSLEEIFPALTVAGAPFAPEPGGIFIYVADSRDEFVENNCPKMFCSTIYPDTFGPQEYFLGIKKAKDHVAVLIIFNRNEVENGVGDSYGAYYATKTLKQLVGAGSAPEIAVHDWPDFGVRGILEGFYGKPWPDDGRLDMVDWMSDYKFNIFLYTPKDDHKLRFGWRLKLTDKELEEVKYINELASDNYVRYCWSLSPGVSINYSSEKDMKNAYFKFKSVIEGAGVKCFSLAFDDVGPTLTPYDQENYDTYWAAQVDFTNRVLGKLMDEYPDVTFAFVPNDYWGSLAMDSEYLRYVGEHLDQRLSIGWTGDEIAPDRIVAEDAEFYTRFIRRPPFLGDNFPVLDNVDRDSGRLALGPLTGRDPRLYRYVKGFAGNAMPLPLSSKPAYVTVADFAWNPFDYDAETSWVNAMKSLAGENYYEPLLFFAQQSRSSLIWKYDALELHERTRAVIRAMQDLPHYNMEECAPPLREMLRRFSGIGKELDQLRHGDLAGMLDEMQAWIDKLEAYGNVGLEALDLLEAKHSGGDIDAAQIDEVEKEWQKVEENKVVITRMVMHNFLKKSIALLRDEEVPEDEKLNSLLGE